MKHFFSGGKPQLAVLAAFFANGALMATWVSRIPAIQTRLGMSNGTLGIILLGLSSGILTALSLTGGLIARFGSPKITLVGAIGMCCTLPLLAIASSPVLLFISLFVFGGMMSAMDVAMNEQAVLVEHKLKRTLMSSFHAGYSVGGLAGSLIGAGMAAMPNLPPLVHFVVAAVIFGGISGLLYPHLLPVEQGLPGTKVRFRLPERALWALGAIAFCSAIAEGAMADWSGVYLAQAINTSTAFAALGYAAFSLTMTIGRALGDFLSGMHKPVFLVRISGVVAALGLLLLAVTDIPVLSGPPLIGLISETASLRVAFLLIALLLSTLLVTARAVSSMEINIKTEERKQ